MCSFYSNWIHKCVGVCDWVSVCLFCHSEKISIYYWCIKVRKNGCLIIKNKDIHIYYKMRWKLNQHRVAIIQIFRYIWGNLEFTKVHIILPKLITLVKGTKKKKYKIFKKKQKQNRMTPNILIFYTDVSRKAHLKWKSNSYSIHYVLFNTIHYARYSSGKGTTEINRAI